MLLRRERGFRFLALVDGFGRRVEPMIVSLRDLRTGTSTGFAKNRRVAGIAPNDEANTVFNFKITNECVVCQFTISTRSQVKVVDANVLSL